MLANSAQRGAQTRARSTSRFTNRPFARTTTVLSIAALAALGACSPGTAGDDTHPGGTNHTQGEGQTASPDGAPLVVTDAWAKAVQMDAEHPMTGVFMKLSNPTDEPLTVASAASSAARMVELHETVADENGSTTMQKVEGGFTIAPGADRVLEPGGEHVMLMGMTQDLIAGDEVEVILTLADGTEIRVTAAVRDFAGAKEEYSHEETSEH
jgi:copper(I)-binding protein